jgi:tetratricopeptide (TPR) repeat protein
LAATLGRWNDVAALYDGQLPTLREAQPERFVELALRLAQVFETQVENLGEAITRNRLALDVEPDNWTALSSLDRLLSATERWAELVPILAKESEVGPTPDELLEFKFRLGQVHQLALNDLPAAIQCYREVLAAAPEHVATIEALESLFAEGHHQDEIAAVLQPIFETTGDWDKLSAIYEAQLSTTTGGDERLAGFYGLAELQEERLLSPVAALAIYVRAIKEHPNDEKSLTESERLAASVEGGWDTLANAYADVLEASAEPATQASIGKRLARLFEEELGDIGNAEKTYRYVLGVANREADTLAQLDRIYSSLEQYAELAEILEQRASLPAEAIDLVERYVSQSILHHHKVDQI